MKGIRKMADENSVYNITEYDSSRTYSRDDIVVVFERFASNSVPNSVPKSAKYYYSTSNNNSGVDSSSLTDAATWGGVTRWNDKTKPEFIWAPSYNNTVDNTPRINSVVFGNGYEQRHKDGIFNNLIKISLKFEHRNTKEAQAINHFLRARNGAESFVFNKLPEPYNDLNAGGYTKLFVCKGFTNDFVFYNNYTISATFEEVNN